MRPSQALVGRYVRTNEGTGLVISCRRSGGLLVQLPGDRVREFSRQTVAVVDPPTAPPPRRCIHCGGNVTPGTCYPDVCGGCQELLADMEGDDDEPAPPPAPQPAPPWPTRPRRFEPDDDDMAAYREMLASHSFEPYRSHVKPHHTRSRWGVALENWTKAGCPDPPAAK